MISHDAHGGREREREREKEECGAGDLVFGGPSASSLGESVDLNHSPHAVGWVCPKSPTKSGGPSWVQVGGGLQGEWSATGVHGPGNVRSIQSCDAAFASGLQRSGCVPCAVAPQQFMVWSLTPMSHEPVWSSSLGRWHCGDLGVFICRRRLDTKSQSSGAARKFGANMVCVCVCLTSKTTKPFKDML